MNNKKIKFLRAKLKFDNMFMVESVGRSGGLAMLWSNDLLLSIQNFSRRHINGTIIRKSNGDEWKLTGFYGQPDATKERSHGSCYNTLRRYLPSHGW
jgi:hypothetical protein